MYSTGSELQGHKRNSQPQHRALSKMASDRLSPQWSHEKQTRENTQEQKLSSTETALDHRPVHCAVADKSGRSPVLSAHAHWCSEAILACALQPSVSVGRAGDPALLHLPTTQGFPLPLIKLETTQWISVAPWGGCGCGPVWTHEEDKNVDQCRFMRRMRMWFETSCGRLVLEKVVIGLDTNFLNYFHQWMTALNGYLLNSFLLIIG